METGDQHDALISGLRALRMVAVRFLPICSVSQSWSAVPLLGLSWSVLPLEIQIYIFLFSPVASCAMFIWDYLITFSMEVELVWKSKWGFMKGLYLLQRYLPFIDTVGLVLYGQFRYFLSTFLPSSFCSSNANGVGEDCVWEDIPSSWRFVRLTCATLTWWGTEFILLPVLVPIGFAASERTFDVHFLFRVILIGV